jgi:alpha-tubulin suppressor-like RCC1 family protein
MSCDMACGVDHNRDVWCLGFNYRGSLQTGSTEEVLTVARRRLDVRNIEQVNPYSYSFLGRHTDGSVYFRPTIPSTLMRFPLPAPATDIQSDPIGGYCAILSTGQLACFLDTGEFTELPIVSGLDDVVGVTVGFSDNSAIDYGGGHYCALKRDGTVWCWGHNEYGQAGTPPASGEICNGARRHGLDTTWVYARYYCLNRPRQVPGLTDVVEIDAGFNVTCARKRDGTVWCWGKGPLGDGLPNTELCPVPPWDPPSQTPRSTTCRARPSRVAGLTGATSISAGNSVACALLTSRELWCWGGDPYYDGTPVSNPPTLAPWPLPGRDE